MRTLVDLLSDERGYVRIFAESGGYGYELATYESRPVRDLFERMCGYSSLPAACEAARFQLSSIHPVRRMRKRAPRRRLPDTRAVPQSLPL